MSERIKSQYDSLYTAEKNVFGGGKPVEAVQKLSDYLKGGKVLDLGGGEGRNALYLAEKGFSVSVYDISEVGIERIDEISKERDLDIDTRVVDITKEKIEGEFDSVLLTFVLHHLDTSDARKLILGAKEHTMNGGVHVISTFSNQGDLHDRNETSKRFYPDEATLRELYKDWDIKEISDNEVTTHARDKNGERMKNHTLTLIAVNSK